MEFHGVHARFRGSKRKISNWRCTKKEHLAAILLSTSLPTIVSSFSTQRPSFAAKWVRTHIMYYVPQTVPSPEPRVNVRPGRGSEDYKTVLRKLAVPEINQLRSTSRRETISCSLFGLLIQGRMENTKNSVTKIVWWVYALCHLKNSNRI